MRLDCELQKWPRIAKLSGGDLIAIEAKYPYNCLSADTEVS